MTTSLAQRLQTCFTSGMTTITSRRESKYDKAVRIISDPDRVIPSPNARPPHWWTGKVVGDHGTYHAFAVSPEIAEKNGLPGRLGCFCRAGEKSKLCSHALVAEEMRLRGEGS
jgi:hypothetical protein